MKRFVCLLTILALFGYHGIAAQGVPSTTIVEVAPGVFVAEGQVALADAANRGAISNNAFIVGADAVAVIDTGGSMAAGMALKAAIRRATDRPIRYVINTHMHPDHVLGNAAFADEGTVFAGHAKLPRALAARAEQYLRANRQLIGEEAFSGSRIVPPTLLVEAQTTIDLGNRVLRLTAQPTAHTDNDLTIYDETTGTLFLGDLLFAGHLPVIDGSLNGWLGVLDTLAALKAARAVAGHGPASLPWPAAIAAERAYLTALRTDLRGALGAGWPLARAMSDIKAEGAEHWRLVDAYHKRNISAGYAEMEWE